MDDGGILALDLATVTGWAYGRSGAGRPFTGCWSLLDDDQTSYAGNPGEALCRFSNALSDFFAIQRPSRVFVEAPLPPRGSRNAASAVLALQLIGALHEGCFRAGLSKPVAVHLNTVRAEVIGTSRFINERGKSDPKPAVMAFVHAMGISVPDHNAADAAVLWLYAIGYRAPRQAGAKRRARR